MKQTFQLFLFSSFLLVFGVVGVLQSPSLIHAQESDTVTVEFYWGDGCPHCAKAKPFLKELDDTYNKVIVESYEVYYDQDNAEQLADRASDLGVTSFGVPFIVIGDQYVIGYGGDSTTGKDIIQKIEEELGRDLVDSSDSSEDSSDVIDESGAEDDGNSGKVDEEKIDVPIIGSINPESVSIPLLAIVLGTVDGFNPCAMWALLFLISLLVNIQNKRRMWILGTTFIVTSALIYLVFMTAWLNLFLFVGYVKWMRIAIGLVAIGAGIYHFYDFYQNKSGCKVTNTERRRHILHKIKDVVKNKSFFLAMIGIITLAVTVNMIEMVCSAGLPAIFTHVLSINELSGIQYASYMILYILFFLIDDLIVFFIAMTTLKIIGIEHKYSRIARIIGAIVILAIGLALIFKPEILMFG
jgi:glutaredoxin/uncharacterized membrane protein